MSDIKIEPGTILDGRDMEVVLRLDNPPSNLTFEFCVRARLKFVPDVQSLQNYRAPDLAYCYESFR